MSAKKRYVSSLSEPEAGLVRIVHDPQCAACRQSRQIQEKAQDYSGFGLMSQTATPKSTQLSRAPARGTHRTGGSKGPKVITVLLDRRRGADRVYMIRSSAFRDSD